MRLSRIYISEKVQAFRRIFNMKRTFRKVRHRVDGMFIARQIRKTELCVQCQVDTGVPVGLDISERLFYVTGVGQLCHDCYLP
jgi:hypothetical protein